MAIVWTKGRAKGLHGFGILVQESLVRLLGRGKRMGEGAGQRLAPSMNNPYIVFWELLLARMMA
jgi:hypothetical protein